jgi:bifunctional NMN adenylyltransferase/nudix hydrolase
MTATPETFDTLVFIGRFQPAHEGHLKVIETALAQAKQVLLLIGSARQPRNTRNPFTFEERAEMLLACVPDRARVQCLPIADYTYNNDAWVRAVQETVQKAAIGSKIGLIGHQKDHSSFYLSLFPQWKSVNVPNYASLNSTPLRKAYFHTGEVASCIPQGAAAWLLAFAKTPAYRELAEEAAFIETYKQAWAKAPYPPIFTTVDAVVVQSGHVLLIERRARPGKGLWALPGGFLNPDEPLKDACIRELREETKLKVPEAVLLGSINQQRVFDDPHRSARGRTLTYAFHIELKPDEVLPKVKGSDDAKAAFWVPLAQVQPEKMFEDHYHIIQVMTAGAVTP